MPPAHCVEEGGMPKRLGLSPSLTRSPAELTRLGLPPQSSRWCNPGHCRLPGPSEQSTLLRPRSSCAPGGLAPPRDVPPWQLRGARALQTCINKALIPAPAATGANHQWKKCRVPNETLRAARPWPAPLSHGREPKPLPDVKPSTGLIYVHSLIA